MSSLRITSVEGADRWLAVYAATLGGIMANPSVHPPLMIADAGHDVHIFMSLAAQVADASLLMLEERLDDAIKEAKQPIAPQS